MMDTIELTNRHEMGPGHDRDPYRHNSIVSSHMTETQENEEDAHGSPRLQLPDHVSPETSTADSPTMGASGRGVTVQEAIIEAGGLGRFQRWASFVFVLTMAAGSYALYPMFFYELVPQYLCKYG
jgi:hypothetical protein